MRHIMLTNLLALLLILLRLVGSVLQSRTDLILENIALRQQAVVLKKEYPRKNRSTPGGGGDAVKGQSKAGKTTRKARRQIMLDLGRTSAIIMIAFFLAFSVFAADQADRRPGPSGRRVGISGPAKADESEPQWVKPAIEAAHTFYRTFHSPTINGPVSYLIYLPPQYDQSPDKRFPVMYWLHGRGGAQTGIPAFVERLTKAVEAGKTPPMIVVFVNGLPTGSYVDSFDGKQPVESVTIKDLIPHIDKTYRTIAAREGRIVEGFSMGGSGAAKWGFKHPELFCGISIFAGALHDLESLSKRDGGALFQRLYGGNVEYFKANDPWSLAEKNADAVRGRTAIRIVVGGKDGLQVPNRKYHELLDRLKIEHEFHVIEDAGHNHGPLYDGLGDKNWAFYGAALGAKPASSTPPATGQTDVVPSKPKSKQAPQPAKPSRRVPREPGGGILFYAKHGYEDNTAAIANPHVVGGWMQFYWSEIEPEKGKYDWSRLDARMKPWLEAGKKVALRIYWIGSGYWKDPAAQRPTPQWVWNGGAKRVLHQPSGTEIPLPWDPIYKKHAFRFMQEIAHKYDNNPNILFFDVTPGAETNPYRYVAFNQLTPDFKEQYASTPASDGRTYSDELWLNTVREYIDFADQAFRHLPLLVTLNVASLNLQEQHDYSVEIGQHCVDRGFYVGQNGLGGSSYLNDSNRKRAFAAWAPRTKIFFETLGEAGTATKFGRKSLGSLMDTMKAAERGSASYLLPYPRDILKGTQGQPDYDPAYEQALAYGARVLGKEPQESLTEASVMPASRRSETKAAAARTTSTASTPSIKNFQLNGDRWTCEANGQPLQGILVKPEGQGPFPAIIISHGMGANAEIFALPKAREFVKWGLVCIGTNYTHAERQAREGDRSRFGASPENVRRALACVEILRSLPYVDAKRVCAYGNSMGAFLTIGLCAEAPDRIRAAAISAGGVTPTAGFAAPTPEAAAKVQTPFLILHGSDDPVVPPERSALFKEILDKNHVPNERHLFDGLGHNVHRDKAQDVYRLMQDWFTKYGVLK